MHQLGTDRSRRDHGRHLGFRHRVRLLGGALMGTLLSALLAACGGGGSSSAPLQVFIFAGQSNMLGADAVISADRVQDLAQTGAQTDADRSALFTLGGPYAYAWGDIRGHDGVSFGERTIGGATVKVHGPEVGFNRALGGGVAVIKYADNFTALENGRSPWVAGGSKSAAWLAFVDKQLAALDRPYVVAGYVWFQGIDDGILGRSHDPYKSDLQAIAATLRAKYGAAPFVLGRSVNSQIAGTANMEPIRRAQDEVGAEPGNAEITVDDLTPYVNTHHLTAASQLVAGGRFAVALLKAAPAAAHAGAGCCQ